MASGTLKIYYNDAWEAVGFSGDDFDAFHRNVANEFSALTEKTVPVDADIVVIEDSADGFRKKKLEVGNLPGGGSGAPTDASYVTTSAEAGLSNESVLAAATRGGIKISSGATLAVASGIFITDIEGSGGSSISDENWEAGTSPANKVSTDADSDGDAIVVHVEVDAGPLGAIGQGWQPTVTIQGADAPVAITNLSPVATDSRRFAGSAIVAIATPGDYTIYADSADGGRSQDVTVTRTADPPEIDTLVYDDQGTNADLYPVIQTQVKQGDTIKISGQTDRTDGPFDIYIDDWGVTNGEGVQGPFATNATGAFSAAITAGFGTIVVGTGNDASALLRCRAKVTGGSFGTYKTATGSVDKSQTLPSIEAFSQADCTYPATQEAIKDTETVDVHITHDNIEAGDTYLYDNNSTGELTIPATTTYAASKTLTRLAGNYRESGTNYRLTVTRTEKNGATATRSMTVKIAHTTPVITILGATSRLRTDDGTDSYLDSTITVRSSQANLSTYAGSVSLALDGGHSTPPVFQGSWSASGDLDYTRSLRVADATFESGGTAGNTWTWGALTVKNRAGKEATVVTTNTSYNCGGFQEREFFHPVAPAHEIDIGCLVVDVTKLTCENVVKGSNPVYEASIQHREGSPPSANDFFTISDGADSFDADNQHWHSNDKTFSDTVSSPTSSVIRVEETA